MKRFLFGSQWFLASAWLWLFATTTLPVYSQAESTSAGFDERNRIVTFCAYNLRNYLKMPRSVDGAIQEKALKPDKEIAPLIEILATIKPDILGVCEIGDAEDLADLQARLKVRDIDLPHSEMGNGGDPTRRLALLSRFPITSRNSQSELKYHIGT
ncbi:endonuclease/exonuclease/phosphatase family protein [Verrucomicrobium spinosum]|uniref:endonuclease/exonuclease/phosphatase family protein n=1 Tax=Verrucomicrobium spinosum TaxID=2736 RepID=UPI0009467253|nr:endonuclease/exonuclease/phosphatase family protein [Verrucomicrobium spinosum]